MFLTLHLASIPSGILGTVLLLWILWKWAAWYLRFRKLAKACSLLPAYGLRFYHILGHIQLYVSSTAFCKSLPYQVYIPHSLMGLCKLSGKDGLVLLWSGWHPRIFIYGSEAAEVILNSSTEIHKSRDYDYFIPWLGSGILTSHGIRWKKQRKLLAPIFHLEILNRYMSVFNRQSRILVQVLQNNVKDDCVDLLPMFKRCSFDIICESTLGTELKSQTNVDCEYVKMVQRLTMIIMDRFYKPWLWPEIIFNIHPTGKEFHRLTQKVNNFATNIIDQRISLKSEEASNERIVDEKLMETERKKKKSLLDLLLDLHLEHNSISIQEIVDELNTFIVAGHDTTAITMVWTLYMIGLYPDVQEKLHAEMDEIFGDDDDRDVTVEDFKRMNYLEMVYKETMRLYPTVPALARELQNDIFYKGMTIPKNSTCLVVPYILHHDPEVFPNPEVFDPERFHSSKDVGRSQFAYIPFSAGPRNCIGQKYATMEMKCILSYLMRTYEVRSLDQRDKIHVMFEIVLTPYGGIRMQIQERKKITTK